MSGKVMGCYVIINYKYILSAQPMHDVFCRDLSPMSLNVIMQFNRINTTDNDLQLAMW